MPDHTEVRLAEYGSALLGADQLTPRDVERLRALQTRGSLGLDQAPSGWRLKADATVGILAAINARHATGEGQHVEVNLLASALSGLVNQTGAYVAGDVVPTRMGNAHPSLFPYEPLPASDGDIIIIAGNDVQFARLCKALGVPELIEDELLLALPLVPRHDVCPAPLPRAFVEDDPATDPADNPFAALAALKNDRPLIRWAAHSARISSVETPHSFSV